MSSSFVYFIFAVIVSSISMLLIMLVKIGLRKYISARLQYGLDSVFFVLLAIPFIPRSLFKRLFSYINLRNWLNNLHIDSETVLNAAASTSDGTGLQNSVVWLQDFAVSVNRSTEGHFPMVLIGVWIVGVIIFAIIVLLCNHKLRLTKESVIPVKDARLLSLFLQCKEEIGVKSNVMLGTSILAKAPMTIGFLRTLIILPADTLSPCDTRYAMLHELAHCKNKDVQINIIMCLFQILYWFNPLVYFIFRQIRLDRELACDAIILEMLPQESYANYGGTLLNFAYRQTMFSMAAGIGDSKPQITKRIRHIVSYTGKSKFARAKAICIAAIAGFLVICHVTAVSTFAGTNIDDRFHFAANNVQYIDLSYFFGDFEGSFVLYDIDAGLYTIHNKAMSTTRVSPNSTYKIFSALIALETGVLDADTTGREWNGEIQPFETWNQNHNLVSAMQYSVNWYFTDLDLQVGIDRLHYYLSRLSYGNSNLTGGISDFWIESSLRISPVEQVLLLRDFYLNDTIFGASHVDTMKDTLRLYERDGTVLSGKTGTGVINNQFVNGWFVGYVEVEGRTFIFATYIRGEAAGGSTASCITLEILEYMGINLWTYATPPEDPYFALSGAALSAPFLI